MTPEQHQSKIIAGIIQAQVGSPGVSDLIDKHIAEYFTRFKSYKDKFTYLEWYHIFLDFADKIPALSPSLTSNPGPRWVAAVDEMPVQTNGEYYLRWPTSEGWDRLVAFYDHLEKEFYVVKENCSMHYLPPHEHPCLEWLSEDPAPQVVEKKGIREADDFYCVKPSTKPCHSQCEDCARFSK